VHLRATCASRALEERVGVPLARRPDPRHRGRWSGSVSRTAVAQLTTRVTAAGGAAGRPRAQMAAACHRWWTDVSRVATFRYAAQEM